MLDIRENQPLATLTTFHIGGPARYFAEATTPAHLAEAVAWARRHNVPLFILGGGSNLLIRDTGFPGLVLHIVLRGIAEPTPGLLEAAAGEPWDAFVDYAIARNLAGIECLAGIPGSVGGTPVQNVGAYGQEVSETIVAVHAFDRDTQTFLTFDHAACRFRYRASLFNGGSANEKGIAQPNRYIVHRVDFQLRPNAAPTLRYADLQSRFASAATPPTLAETAAAVRDIRRSKGMLIVPEDPNTRSAGSFFKNPIVPPSLLTHIAAILDIAAATIPNWPAPSHQIKLPAAWLLEQAGFNRGFGTGPAAISTCHTLALINRSNATCADIERLQDEITTTVANRFGITLEREPVLVG